MAQPKRKSKRNIFTLSPPAQILIDQVGPREKSRTVSTAIINHLKKERE
jgi:hypothetical protein